MEQKGTPAFPSHSLQEWIQHIEQENKVAYAQLYHDYEDFSVEPAHAQMDPAAEELHHFFQGEWSPPSPHLYGYYPYAPEKEATLQSLIQLAQTWEIDTSFLDLRYSEQVQPSFLSSHPYLDWSHDLFLQAHLSIRNFSAPPSMVGTWILADTWQEFHFTPAQQIKLILQAYDFIMKERGEPPAAILIAVSPRFLIEIAKLRALQFLLYKAYQQVPQILVRTEFSTLTRLDVHNNLIRLTLEVYAALLGNCHGLFILPYTFWTDPWDPDAYRYSWNIFHLLHYESHITQHLDAVTSSYGIETLTARVVKAVQSLSMPPSLLPWIQDGERRIRGKDRTLIGVTKYRDPKQAVAPASIEWQRISPKPLIQSLYYESLPPSH